MKQRIEQLNKDANNSKSHIDELNRQASDTQVIRIILTFFSTIS